MSHEPARTPPAYVELLGELTNVSARHEVALEQVKRDMAWLLTHDTKHGERLERVLERLDGMDHRLLAIEKLLTIVAEQGRTR